MKSEVLPIIRKSPETELNESLPWSPSPKKKLGRDRQNKETIP